MLRLPALTATLPASPLLPVSAVMPVGTDDDVPSIDSAPATVTAMLPPLPVPNVSVVIWPLGPMVKDPALTMILPAFPVLPVTVRAVMPVEIVDDVPSIDNAPVTVTAMLPPLPDFAVSVVISPSGPMAKVPAWIATLPPLPEPKVSLEMPPEPVTVNLPALTATFPAFPDPKASLEIVAFVDNGQVVSDDADIT